MGAYSYKYVRDQLPYYLTDAEDYEGGANYDGDQWHAASNYITELENELAFQYRITRKFDNEKLLEWLKSRESTSYADGPVIKE